MTPPPNIKPQFVHDCQECKFLGTATIGGNAADYYAHEESDHVSLIARFGDDPSDYESSRVQHITPLSLHLSVALALYLRRLNVTGMSYSARATYYAHRLPVLSTDFNAD